MGSVGSCLSLCFHWKFCFLLLFIQPSCGGVQPAPPSCCPQPKPSHLHRGCQHNRGICSRTCSTELPVTATGCVIATQNYCFSLVHLQVIRVAWIHFVVCSSSAVFWRLMSLFPWQVVVSKIHKKIAQARMYWVFFQAGWGGCGLPVPGNVPGQVG